MTESELKQWRAVTESSRHQWMEDDITRLNGKGALYYFGGEEGVYMRILSDGKFLAGPYEGAFPHIGDACFMMETFEDCGSFDQALQKAIELGGPKFLQDMPSVRFSQEWNAPDEFSGMGMNMM